MEIDNIYAQLASIPSEIADNITNAKTGGGRSLNAIHASKTLTQLEKHLLLVLGSEMNFCKDFINQYRYISLNDLAEKISINQRTVSSLLNGTTRRGEHIPGLIEKGYVNKRVPTLEEQKKFWKTHYCITNKIFNEYMILLIEEAKKKAEDEGKKRGGSDPGSEGGLILDQRGSDPGSDKDPSKKDPSIKTPPISNAVVENPAAVKKIEKPKQEKKSSWKPAPKIKLWVNKSNEEKMDTVLNKAVDAHRTAVERKKAKPAPFTDFPDVLEPVLKEYGVEVVREFFDFIDGGCDIRIVARELRKFATFRSKPPD